MRILTLITPALITPILLPVAAAAAPQEKVVDEHYDLVKIAHDVYPFIAPETENGLVLGNCTVIIGQESVLVFDTGQFPTLAKQMVADIQKLTPKRVVWGNGVFREAYPGVAIISTEFTRQMVESEGPKLIANQLGSNAQQVAELRKMIASDKSPDGRPVTPERKQLIEHIAGTYERMNSELALTVHTPPTIGFDKELTIDLGKRELKVLCLGRANTAGDAVVWLPDAKLLLTGDALKYPAPFAFGSYMSEWPTTLQNMIDLHPSIVVPGHGSSVLHDTSYLALLIETFQALSAQVKSGAVGGASLDDVRKKVTLEEFKPRFDKLARTEGRRTSGFAMFLSGGIDRAYQEATGNLKLEGID